MPPCVAGNSRSLGALFVWLSVNVAPYKREGEARRRGQNGVGLRPAILVLEGEG
jgi:hypothetical protein